MLGHLLCGEPSTPAIQGHFRAPSGYPQLIHTALGNGIDVFFELASHSEIHFIFNLIYTHELKLL